jgi:hypothetical protein
MRQVSVESFVASSGLMGAAVWATANLIDLRYSKVSSIPEKALFDKSRRLTEVEKVRQLLRASGGPVGE